MSKRKADRLHRSFGQRIRTLRRATGLSQIQLGQRADLDHTYIGGIERGERSPTVEALAKLAKGLDVEIPDLFRYKKGTRPRDECLNELMALLEGQDLSTVSLSLDLVKVIVESNRRT